jgi:hypothetical protein
VAPPEYIPVKIPFPQFDCAIAVPNALAFLWLALRAFNSLMLCDIRRGFHLCLTFDFCSLLGFLDSKMLFSCLFKGVTTIGDDVPKITPLNLNLAFALVFLFIGYCAHELVPEIHELHGDGKFMGAHGGIKPVAVRAHD